MHRFLFFFNTRIQQLEFGLEKENVVSTLRRKITINIIVLPTLMT